MYQYAGILYTRYLVPVLYSEKSSLCRVRVPGTRYQYCTPTRVVYVEYRHQVTRYRSLPGTMYKGPGTRYQGAVCSYSREMYDVNTVTCHMLGVMLKSADEELKPVGGVTYTYTVYW